VFVDPSNLESHEDSRHPRRVGQTGPSAAHYPQARRVDAQFSVLRASVPTDLHPEHAPSFLQAPTRASTAG